MFGELLDVPAQNLVENGGEITIKNHPPQYEVQFNDVGKLRDPRVWFDARVLKEIITYVVP